MPLSRLVTGRLGKHKFFFLAIEIAVVKIFYVYYRYPVLMHIILV